MVKLKDILKEAINPEIKLDKFAEKRGKATQETVDKTKEKGGLAMLSHNHFKVKLPYYKKAAAGKFDMDKFREEYVTLLDQLHKSTLDEMKIDQKAFQELVGKIEVIGELCIRNKEEQK